MLRRLVVVLAGLVAAWLVACAVLFVWPSAETGAPAHADAVVMLAGDRARLPAAEAAVRAGVAPTLVLSRIQETRIWIGQTHLCDAGRYGAARVVCFAAHPYSTRGEARAVARLARERGWHSIVVVSSTYHLTRANLLFHRCWNGRLYFVGVGDVWWRLPIDWALETGKLLVQETVERGC